MGIFAGIKDQSSNNQSTYLSAGSYLLEIISIRLVESKKSSDEFFVVEARVVESSGEEATSEGEEVAWVLKMGGRYPESALKDVNSFLKSATGAKDGDIDEEFVEDILEGDGEKLVGFPVRCDVINKVTKSGSNFSKHHWKAPVNSEEPPF